MYAKIANHLGLILGSRTLVWLILSAIIGSAALDGCTPTSVRSGSVKYVSKSTKKKGAKSTRQKVKDETFMPDDELADEYQNDGGYLSDLKKFEEKTLGNKTNSPSNDDASQLSIRRIPTLREQMQLFSDDQKTIAGKVGSLQGDVTEIKSTLEDIKDVLKSVVFTKPPQPSKGEPVIVKSLSDSRPAATTGEQVIQSDEVVKVKKDSKSLRKKHSAPATIKEPVKQKPEYSPNATQSKEPATSSNSTKTLPQPQNQPTTSGSQYIEPPAEIQKYAEQPDLNAALVDFSKKDYHNAINKLSKIADSEKNPEALGDCYYWLGEAHFGLKQYDQAISYFRKAIAATKSARKDDAQIMIAESQLRSGMVTQAKESFQALISNFPKSEYIPRARKMLQQL